MSNTSISTSAVLADLTIRVWTASKKDKKNTAKVTSDNHADANAARVYKSLFVKVPEYDKIKSYAAESRTALKKYSLPWSDAGIRLLPTTNVWDCKAEFNKRQAEYYALVDDFVQKYPSLLATQAFRLNGLFNREDYPTADEVRAKFEMTLNLSPLPESGDFRLDIPREAQEELRQEYEAQFGDRVAEAMAQVREELYEGIAHLHERLGYDGDKKRVFRDTTVSNVIDMLSRVKALNITQDAAFDAVGMEAAAVLGTVTPDELRKNEAVRDDVRSRLEEMRDKFSF